MEGRARRSVMSTRPSCGWWRFRIPSPLTRPRGQRALSVMADDPAPAPSDSVPARRPLERFWPYVELTEAPTDDELAALDPDLHAALFGARNLPFSVTLVFPPFAGAALRRGAGARPGRRRVPRGRQRRGAAASRPVLLLRRRRAARSLPARRRVAADRGADRRSAGALRARAVAAAGLVPAAALDRAAAHHQRVRPAAPRARGGDQEARGRVQPVLRRAAAEAAVGDALAGGRPDQALRPAADSNTAERFRFQGLQSRFSAFCELWERNLRTREGSRPGARRGGGDRRRSCRRRSAGARPTRSRLPGRRVPR